MCIRDRDTTGSEINGRSDVNLVSLNPNLSLKLENVAGEGWFIKHGEINSQDVYKRQGKKTAH